MATDVPESVYLNAARRFCGKDKILAEGMAQSLDFRAAILGVWEARGEHDVAAIERVRDAERRMRSVLVTVFHRLDQPYPDAPEQSPWTRFVKPAYDNLHNAVRDLAALDAQRPAEGGPEPAREWRIGAGYARVTWVPTLGTPPAAAPFAIAEIMPDSTTPPPSPPRAGRFEELLTAEHEQFDQRGELLNSITEYMNAPSGTVSAPPPSPEGEGAADPIERDRALARAEVELVQRWWVRDGEGYTYRVVGPKAAAKVKAEGWGGVKREEFEVVYDFEFRPSSSRYFPAALDGGQPDTPTPSAEALDDYDSGAGWNRVGDAMDRYGAAAVLANPDLVEPS